MIKKIIGVMTVVAIIGAIVWAIKPRPTVAPATNQPAASSTTASETPLTATLVAAHNNQTSCWAIVGDKVYDLTSWISQHPGGSAAILGLCGTDGTAAFSRQHGSNQQAQAALANFFIGVLGS